MAKKLDGVIEAVHFARDGKIDLVRAYERRGVTFSDRVLIDRGSLLQRIKDGKVFYTGRRKEYLASTFELQKRVFAVPKNGVEILTTRADQPGRDELEGTPAF